MTVPNFYIVSRDNLLSLLEDSAKLHALEAGGVDNWIEYCDACQTGLEDYWEEYSDIINDWYGNDERAKEDAQDDFNFSDVAQMAIIGYKPFEGYC